MKQTVHAVKKCYDYIFISMQRSAKGSVKTMCYFNPERANVTRWAWSCSAADLPQNRLWLSWSIHFKDFLDVLQHWWSLWNTFSREVFLCWQSNSWHCNTKIWTAWWLGGLPGCRTIKKSKDPDPTRASWGLSAHFSSLHIYKMFEIAKVNLSLAI